MRMKIDAIPGMTYVGTIESFYGWACYGCLTLIIGFLLFDSPIRRHRSYMVPWRLVGMAIGKYYKLSN